jgi:hypothetical protein
MVRERGEHILCKHKQQGGLMSAHTCTDRRGGQCATWLSSATLAVCSAPGLNRTAGCRHLARRRRDAGPRARLGRDRGAGQGPPDSWLQVSCMFAASLTARFRAHIHASVSVLCPVKRWVSNTRKSRLHTRTGRPLLRTCSAASEARRAGTWRTTSLSPPPAAT